MNNIKLDHELAECITALGMEISAHRYSNKYKGWRIRERYLTLNSMSQIFRQVRLGWNGC